MFKVEFPATRAVELYRQMTGAPQAPASGGAVAPDEDLAQPSGPQHIAAVGEPATASDLVIRLTVDAPADHRRVDIAIKIGTPAAAAEGRLPVKVSASKESVR